MATGTVTINSNTSDGFIGGLNQPGETWYDVQAHATGQQVYPTWYLRIGSQYGFAGSDWWIYRTCLFFDTSVISGGNILGATAQVYLSGKYITNNATAWSVVVQNGQVAGQDHYPHEPFVKADYNYTYYSGTGASLAVSAQSTGSYQDFVFNSTGLNWLNTTGTTRLMLRSSRDISATIPVASPTADVHEFMLYYDENTGTPPKLIIDYEINLAVPTVTLTKPVAHLSSTGVSVTGNITDLGGASATTRGFCYATATTPTTASMTAGAAGSFGISSFTYNITGISASTLYHCRSFAINSAGVGYSSTEVHFDVETQTTKVGIKSLNPKKGLSKKLNILLGVLTAVPRYSKRLFGSKDYYKTFILGKAATYFPYSFTFPFSTDGSGIGLSTKVPEWVHVLGITFIRWLPSKDNPLLLGISTSPMIKSLSFNRQISTQLGIVLVQQLRAALKRVLSTTVGLIPSSLQRLSFIRQISTKVGALPLIKNAGKIKREILTQVAVYTKGIWSSYNYCKIVTINPSTDGALSSYPIKLTIHRTTGTDSGSDVYVGTDCSFDYSDIYFDTVEGVALWYWIESYTDDYAVVWIKAINIPASPTTTQIRFYYGSTIVSIRNSGVNTFTFFDDFSAGLSKWTTDSGCSIIGEELVVQSTSTATKTAYSNTSFGTNYAMRARLKSAHISGNYIEDASISDAVDGHGVGVSYCSYYSAYNNTYYNLNVDGGRTYLPVSGWVAANTYYLQDIIRNGSTDSKFYVNNLNYVSVTGVDVDSHPIRFFTTNNTAKLTIDWVLIRPWTASEPSFGIWGSKVTTADSPFKNYLLKVYDIFSTKIGLIATKYSGLGYKFSTIKLGLTSAISNAAGFIKSFTNKIGIKNEILKSLSFTRIFNLATGLVSNMHRSIEQILSTAIGFISNLGYLHAYSFIVSIGLISEHVFNRGFNKTITTVLGLIPTVGRNIYIQLSTKLGLLTTLGLIQVGRIFITALGLVATVSKVLQITRIVTTFIGLVSNFRRSSTTTLLTNLGLLATIVPKSGGRVRELLVSIGLIANYTKSMGYYLHTFIGLLSRIDKSINIQRVLQSLIAVMLVSDVRARFEELLSTLIGLVTDFDLHVGGRVRILSTSIGMVANLFRNNYWERLTVSIGIVGRLSMVGLGKSLITKLGVIATTRTNIGRALILSTVIGLVSFVHRRRYDIEVLATKLGIKASNLSSRLFGHKRFKSLKFLDRKTSDNKKLRIKK